MKQYKLTIELVPKPLWSSNPRLAMGRAKWDRLRRQVYEDYGHRCGICGAEGRLEAHECWEYDDDARVQRLSAFVALCGACHRVKHLGLASILAKEGKADMEGLRRHFMDVNGCSSREFAAHAEQALNVWRRRSAHEGWTINWGPYSGFVE